MARDDDPVDEALGAFRADEAQLGPEGDDRIWARVQDLVVGGRRPLRLGRRPG